MLTMMVSHDRGIKVPTVTCDLCRQAIADWHDAFALWTGSKQPKRGHLTMKTVHETCACAVDKAGYAIPLVSLRLDEYMTLLCRNAKVTAAGAQAQRQAGFALVAKAKTAKSKRTHVL
jgi:hypothetical protein